jgi:hypothetical protein
LRRANRPLKVRGFVAPLLHNANKWASSGNLKAIGVKGIADKIGLIEQMEKSGFS